MENVASAILARRGAVISGAILSCVCLSVFLCMLALGWYAHPSLADDYCYATKFMRLGIVGGTVDQYISWSGGYSSIFLSGAIPALFDFISVYKFIPAILILLTALAASCWVMAVCETTARKFTPWVMGIGFVVLYLSMMPSVVTGFYWFNSAMTYQVANILLTVMVALVISLLVPGNDDDKRGRRFIMLGIAICAGMGCTETVMSAMFILMNCICIWRFSVRHDERKHWVAIFLITYAAFFLVVLAPGNSVRAGVSDNAFMLLPSLKNSVWYGWGMLTDYLAMPQLWWASGIALILFCRLGGARDLSAYIRHSHVGAAIMVTLAIPLVFCFPSWLALGLSPPYRTQNAILYMFLLGWFCSTALVAFKYLARSGPVLAVQPVSTRVATTIIVVCVAMSAALLSSSNIRLVSSDLFGKAADYDRSMEHRYALIIAASESGLRTAVVPKLAQSPTSLNYLEIYGSSTEEPFLRCLADYFGIPDVVVEAP